MLIDNIKKKCSEKGLSIYALEKAAGLPFATITNWDKSKPAYDKVIKVAKALGCTVEELAGEI